ncbi:hypothetical protein BDR07DRAFT_1426921 [Suillus spraguei]|nr:hypothetical protein BDR07DRAFT_1426921 [Suillus spraguei]
MQRFRTVLTCDIETRRIFFNTESFLEEDTCLRRWKALDMDIYQKELCGRINEVVKSEEGFHPYSKSKTRTGLCLICVWTGHKASDCMDWYTVKEEGVVCEWDGMLVLKSTSEVVSILFNMGRCGCEYAWVHMYSTCGSQGYGAKRCC